MATSAFTAPFARAMARLWDAMDVPRIGAQPPEMFQLPSLSWDFSIFATHFCKSWRTRALAFASGIVPSNSASNFDVTNVSMYGPSFRWICVPCWSVTREPVDRALFDMFQDKVYGTLQGLAVFAAGH